MCAPRFEPSAADLATAATGGGPGVFPPGVVDPSVPATAATGGGPVVFPPGVVVDPGVPATAATGGGPAVFLPGVVVDAGDPATPAIGGGPGILHQVMMAFSRSRYRSHRSRGRSWNLSRTTGMSRSMGISYGSKA